jgi:hypothetical protein
MNAIINRELATESQRKQLVQAGAWQVYRIRLGEVPRVEQDPICYLATTVTEAQLRGLAERSGVLVLVNAQERRVAIACAAQPHDLSINRSGAD